MSSAARKTYNHYPNGWAMAFNTPFKMWKRYEFKGGTSDPCIVSWPAGIKAKGELRHQYHHAIDLVPTVLDCLGVEPPERIKGHVQVPFDGVSMRYGFDAPDAPTQTATQFYSMLGSRGIWHDGWKAITTHPTIAGGGATSTTTSGSCIDTEVDPGGDPQPGGRAPGQDAGAREPVVLGGGGEQRVPARRSLRAGDHDHAAAGVVAAAEPVRLLPRHGGGARVAGGERPQPVVLDRGRGGHPGAGCGGGACSRTGRSSEATRSTSRTTGCTTSTTSSGCRSRRSSERGRADRREAAPVGLVRQGRRGSAHVSTGILSLYHGDKKVGEARIKTQPGKFVIAGEGLCIGRDGGAGVTDDYPGEQPWRFTGARSVVSRWTSAASRTSTSSARRPR